MPHLNQSILQQLHFRGPCRYYAIGEPGAVKIYRADKVVNACADDKIIVDGETKYRFNHSRCKPDYVSFEFFSPES
jgi:hypothetical protein